MVFCYGARADQLSLTPGRKRLATLGAESQTEGLGAKGVRESIPSNEAGTGVEARVMQCHMAMVTSASSVTGREQRGGFCGFQNLSHKPEWI